MPPKYKYQSSKSIAKVSKINFALKTFLDSYLIIFKLSFVCNKFIDFKFCRFSPPVQTAARVLKFIQNSVKFAKTKKERNEKVYRRAFFGTIFGGFADYAKCRAANARKADSSQNDSSNDNGKF